MTEEVGPLADGELVFEYVSAERAMSCLPEVGDGALRATQPTSLNILVPT